MKSHDLKKLVTILSESGQYRVTQKYQKPEFYNVDNASNKHIGVFLDIETTGLYYTDDKLIELGMVKFEYTEDGRIFRLLDEFSSYQDPNKPIPEDIIKLTGINDDMVRDRKINEHEIADYIQNVDLIISHNAKFDRVFFETTFPSIPPKAWGCSLQDINWNFYGISIKKLEYIAYQYNFFFEGHRAIADCLAGIHILAQDLPNSGQSVLKQLLTNALAIKFKLYTNKCPFEKKNLLKARGYIWSAEQKVWSVELNEDKVEEEINYLRSHVYGGTSINITADIANSVNNRYGRISLPKSKQVYVFGIFSVPTYAR